MLNFKVKFKFKLISDTYCEVLCNNFANNIFAPQPPPTPLLSYADHLHSQLPPPATSQVYQVIEVVYQVFEVEEVV